LAEVRSGETYREDRSIDIVVPRYHPDSADIASTCAANLFEPRISDLILSRLSAEGDVAANKNAVDRSTVFNKPL